MSSGVRRMPPKPWRALLRLALMRRRLKVSNGEPGLQVPPRQLSSCLRASQASRASWRALWRRPQLTQQHTSAPRQQLQCCRRKLTS